MATNPDFNLSQFDRQRTPLPNTIEFSGDTDATEFIATINDLRNERTMSPQIALKRLVLRALLSHSLDNRRMLTVNDAVKFSKDMVSVVPVTEKVTDNELLIPISHPFIQAAAPYSEMDFSPIRTLNVAGAIGTAIVSYIQQRRPDDFEPMCAQIQAARYGNASTRLSDEILDACYCVLNESPDVSDAVISKASGVTKNQINEQVSGGRTFLLMSIFKISISLFSLYILIKLVTAWLWK